MGVQQWVGINVRKFRKEREFSQEALAFECGLHRTYISGVERGIRNPTVIVLEKIVKALTVTRTKKPGVYPDGGGLYLQVTPTGAKSWLFRFMLHGRARPMGLGPPNAVSPAEASVKAPAAPHLRVA